MVKKKLPVVKDYSLYMLLDKTDNSFFIWYCDAKNVYDAFKQHYSFKFSKTKKWIENIKNQNRKPCIFILETINGTRQDCYALTLIWTKIFLENNFISLENEGTLRDVNNIYEENMAKYYERKNKILEEFLDCKNCIFPSFKNITCENFKGDPINKLKRNPSNKKRIELYFDEDDYEFLMQSAKQVGKQLPVYIEEMALNGEVKKLNFDAINNLSKEMQRFDKKLNAYIITLISTKEYFPRDLEEIQKSINDLKNSYRNVIRLLNKEIRLLTKLKNENKK